MLGIKQMKRICRDYMKNRKGLLIPTLRSPSNLVVPMIPHALIFFSNDAKSHLVLIIE